MRSYFQNSLWGNVMDSTIAIWMPTQEDVLLSKMNRLYSIKVGCLRNPDGDKK